MGRRKLTHRQIDFTNLILDEGHKYIKLNITALAKQFDEDSLSTINNQLPLLQFWRENINKFNIFVNIKLKDSEQYEALMKLNARIK